MTLPLVKGKKFSTKTKTKDPIAIFQQSEEQENSFTLVKMKTTDARVDGVIKMDEPCEETVSGL